VFEDWCWGGRDKVVRLCNGAVIVWVHIMALGELLYISGGARYVDRTYDQ
jgi:hypothetical protein